MCGRYTLAQGESAAERFGFHDWHERRIQPRFNIAPSQVVLAVVQTPTGRQAREMRWGFRPAWMRHPTLPPPINARAETLPEKPLWRSALRQGRCLIPADGFYEWRSVPGQQAKQPLHIRLQSGELFAFAGLYTSGPDGGPTCAIVTTEANSLMAPLHPRMPVLLAPEDEAQWLDPALPDPAALLALLRPYPAERMEAVPVGPLVNRVGNDGTELLTPVPEPQPLLA